MSPTHAPDWFAHQVLQWFDRNGRKHLPWQASRDPYAIWLSEIMLQQTQVSTVIPYFTNFLARFPTLQDLAEAPLDDVLHLWTGLGYYARARNLHRAAQQVISQHGGRMPGTVDELLTLPGIGRSTAGAISAMAFGQPAAILDGNVKRVLARFHAIEGWPGQTPVAKQLWALAESHLPKARVADYTQAIMDLGALVCRRSSPDCPACPLRSRCKAHGTGQADRYPGRKPARALPVRNLTFFILCRRGREVLLQRRPAQGIWGGLWSFPEADRHVHELPQALVERLGPAEHLRPWAIERHTLSHFHMDILPLLGMLDSPTALVMEPGDWLWYSWAQPVPVGLAAPVQRLLAKLHSGLPTHRCEQEYHDMTRMVQCKKYGKSLPGLPVPPYPGPKGQEIYDTVSQQAWKEWQQQQTMLINEKHLNMADPAHRQYLQQEMDKFLRNESHDQAEGFTPKAG